MFINSDLSQRLMVDGLEKVLDWYKRAISIDTKVRDTRYFMSLLKRLPSVDQHLFYNIYFRKQALHAYSYTIKFPSEFTPSSSELKQLAEIKTRWEKAYMHSLIDTSMNGRMIGLAAVQLQWENTPYGNMVSKKKSYQPDDLDIDLEDDDLISIIDTDTRTQRYQRRAIDDNTNFYIRYNPMQGFENDYPGAFIRINFLLSLIKYWDLFNWSRKNEKSLTFAQYEERFKAYLGEILTQLGNIGDNSVGAFPKGVEVKVLEQLNQAQVSSHKELQEYIDRAISLTISGQSTAANPDGGHSYAASKIGFQIAANVTYGDLVFTEKEISNQYLVHDYLANYTEPRNAYPIFEFKKYVVGDSESRGRLMTDYVANGIPVHSEDLYDSVGLRRAIEEETFTPSGGGSAIVPKNAEATPSTSGEPVVALNGAQITAATAIVRQVSAGEMGRDAGVNQLITFLNLSKEQAEKVMGSGKISPTPQVVV